MSDSIPAAREGETHFWNYAGQANRDDEIAAELLAAGINVSRSEALRGTGEVSTAVRGDLHGWGFQRAWRYWIAEGPGIELAAAERLHAAHPRTIRVDGHCGCPSPREWFKGLAVGHYHVDSPEGLKALADTIRGLLATPATDGARAGVSDDLRRLSEAATQGHLTLSDIADGWRYTICAGPTYNPIAQFERLEDARFFHGAGELVRTLIADPRPQTGAAPGGRDRLHDALKAFERICFVGGGVFSAEGHERCQEIAVKAFDALAAITRPAADPGAQAGATYPIGKLPDYDPRALRGFAHIARREGDKDACRVLTAAADRIEALEAVVQKPRQHQPYWTGACLGLDGATLNLSFPAGTGEFVFREDEIEQIDEDGRTLWIVKADASEMIQLRHWLNEYLPTRLAPARADATPAPAATGDAGADRDTSRMAEGCCSACSPCSHQKRDPYSICKVCQEAARIGAEREAKAQWVRDLAKDASERAAKNARVAPQLLYAPIRRAIEDALAAQATPPAPSADPVSGPSSGYWIQKQAEYLLRRNGENDRDWIARLRKHFTARFTARPEAPSADPVPAGQGDGAWQPISEAATNGTPYLVGWDTGGWESDKGHCEGGVWGRLTSAMGFEPFPHQPTHFRELDAPPAPSNAGGA